VAEQDTTGFVQSSAGRLEFRAIPPRRAPRPTIVFLHDALGSVSTWRDFPDRVCAVTGAAGLVFSRSGHGRSSPRALPRPHTYLHDEATRVLPEVLGAQRVTRPIVIGHSDGATIALLYAASGMPRPEAVVAIAPHVFVEDLTVAGVRETAARFASSDLRHRLWRHHGEQTDSLFAAWTDVWLDPAFRTWNVESDLAASQSPTLLIQGADDEYGSAAQVERISSRLGARCQTIWLGGCGHFPHLERRDAVVAGIETFLQPLLAG